MARAPQGTVVTDATTVLGGGAIARPTITAWFQFSALGSQLFQAGQDMSLVYVEAVSASIVSKIPTAYTIQAATTVTKLSYDVIAYASGQNFWMGNYQMKPGDQIYFIASTATLIAGIFALDNP